MDSHDDQGNTVPSGRLNQTGRRLADILVTLPPERREALKEFLREQAQAEGQNDDERND